MATTSRPIDLFAIGLRDTAGAVVASGKVRFYNPGTTVQATVYSDAACSTAYAQPITLNAGGQATIYALEAVRCIAKNSAEDTTFYDGNVNLNRADSIYLTVSGISSGNETTLESVLEGLGTSFGSGFQYLESATATVRDYQDVIRNYAIQAADFGVAADGTTDDTTALQNAINRVEGLGGGRVLLPTGTILISSALTIDTAGVSIEGSGRGMSIIKQSSTTANGLNVTLASGDAKLFLKGFTVTASTTSSGTAINCSVGNQVVIEEVSTALFRTGIDTNAITGAKIDKCFVDSTDDNSASIGINLGTRCRATDCEVTSGTDNGSGIKATGTDARATNCWTTNWATAINAAGARFVGRGLHSTGSTTAATLAAADCMLSGGYLTSATTGISITSTYCTVDGVVTSSVTTGVSASGAQTTVSNCNISASTTGVALSGLRSRIIGGTISDATTGVTLGAASETVTGTLISTCTTGISVGAHASCAVANCLATGCTTDLSVNTGATLFTELNNGFTTTTFNAATPGRLARRSACNVLNGTGANPTITPDPSGGKYLQLITIDSGASGLTVTIANTATTNIQKGDEMRLMIENQNAASVDLAWGNQYETPNGVGLGAFITTGAITTQDLRAFDFYWDGGDWVLTNMTAIITT